MAFISPVAMVQTMRLRHVDIAISIFVEARQPSRHSEDLYAKRVRESVVENKESLAYDNFLHVGRRRG
jgi:hypothetical protein